MGGLPGYQGLNKRTKNARIPIKKSKKKPLSYWEKLYNKIVAKRRIKVENVIAEVKNFVFYLIDIAIKGRDII